MSVFGADIDRFVIPNLVFTVKYVPKKGHLIIGKLLINFVSSRKITIANCTACLVMPDPSTLKIILLFLI